MLVVITGGPGSGKTTLVEALAARGFAVVPEAAIQVIAELADELGDEGQRTYRAEHRAAFQRRVLARQLELEAAAAALAGPVFLDRSRLDGLAYCRHFETPPPPELALAAADARYDAVFVLDTLDDFADRSATGRTSDRATSLALRERIVEVYREQGYEPLAVPVEPVEARVERVLHALGLETPPRREAAP